MCEDFTLADRMYLASILAKILDADTDELHEILEEEAETLEEYIRVLEGEGD
jgi:hypothetical protein